MDERAELEALRAEFSPDERAELEALRAEFGGETENPMTEIPLIGGMFGNTSEQGKQQYLDAVKRGDTSAFIGIDRGMQDLGEGIQQLGLEAAEGTNLVPEGAALDYTREKQAERDQFQEQYGEIPTVKGQRALGANAPLFAIPGANATTIPGKMAAGALIGGGVAGSQFVEEGDSRAANAATGAAIGAAVPAVLAGAGKVAGKVKNAASGIFKDPAAKAVVEAGAKHDVPVFAPDVMGKGTRNAAQLAEEVPIIGMYGPRIKQAEKAKIAVNRVVQGYQDKLSNTNYRGIKIIKDAAAKGNKTAINILNEMQNAADDWNAILAVSPKSKAFINAQIGGRKFTRVDALADDLGNVIPNKTLTKIDELIAKEAQAVTPDEQLIRYLSNVKEGLSTRQYKFSNIRDFRSELGGTISDIRKGQNALIGNKSSASLQQVKNAIDQDLDDFIAISGRKEIKTSWEQANKYWRNKVVPLKDRALGNAITNKPADEIFDVFVKKGKAGRAGKFYEFLDPKGRAAVRAGLHDRALEAATNKADGTISPAKYAQYMENQQSASGVFFKGAEKAEHDGFTNLMRHVQRAGQVAENPPTGNRLARMAVAGGAAVLTKIEPTSAAVGGTTIYGLRLLWTTPKGRNFLLASSKLQPGSKQMQSLLNRMNQYVASVPAAESARPDDSR